MNVQNQNVVIQNGPALNLLVSVSTVGFCRTLLTSADPNFDGTLNGNAFKNALIALQFVVVVDPASNLFPLGINGTWALAASDAADRTTIFNHIRMLSLPFGIAPAVVPAVVNPIVVPAVVVPALTQLETEIDTLLWPAGIKNAFTTNCSALVPSITTTDQLLAAVDYNGDNTKLKTFLTNIKFKPLLPKHWSALTTWLSDVRNPNVRANVNFDTVFSDGLTKLNVLQEFTKLVRDLEMTDTVIDVETAQFAISNNWITRKQLFTVFTSDGRPNMKLQNEFFTFIGIRLDAVPDPSFVEGLNSLCNREKKEFMLTAKKINNWDTFFSMITDHEYRIQCIKSDVNVHGLDTKDLDHLARYHQTRVVNIGNGSNTSSSSSSSSNSSNSGSKNKFHDPLKQLHPGGNPNGVTRISEVTVRILGNMMEGHATQYYITNERVENNLGELGGRKIIFISAPLRIAFAEMDVGSIFSLFHHLSEEPQNMLKKNSSSLTNVSKEWFVKDSTESKDQSDFTSLSGKTYAALSRNAATKTINRRRIMDWVERSVPARYGNEQLQLLPRHFHEVDVSSRLLLVFEALTHLVLPGFGDALALLLKKIRNFLNGLSIPLHSPTGQESFDLVCDAYSTMVRRNIYQGNFNFTSPAPLTQRINPEDAMSEDMKGTILNLKSKYVVKTMIESSIAPLKQVLNAATIREAVLTRQLQQFQRTKLIAQAATAAPGVNPNQNGKRQMGTGGIPFKMWGPNAPPLVKINDDLFFKETGRKMHQSFNVNGNTTCRNCVRFGIAKLVCPSNHKDVRFAPMSIQEVNAMIPNIQAAIDGYKAGTYA